MRASSATTPSASASSGLMSIATMQGKSTIICERPFNAETIAARSAGLRSRKPASRRPMRVRSIRSPASTSSSGGSAIAVSSMSSTATPPAPNRITGPKIGSRLTPRISSWDCLRTTIGCTAKPSTRRSGLLRARRCDRPRRVARRSRARDVEHHAADVGFVRDRLGQQLDDDLVRALEQPRRSLPRPRAAMRRRRSPGPAIP